MIKKRGCWSPREDNEEAACVVAVPHCSSPVLVSPLRKLTPPAVRTAGIIIIIRV